MRLIVSRSASGLRLALAALILSVCANMIASQAMAWPAGELRPAMAQTAVQAKHVAPHTCGVSSSKFARICRPGAYTSCIGAASRNVKGFSPTFCAARRTACTTCLTALKLCIKRIGHAARAQYSCDECTGKFSRCIGKRYPQVP